MADKLLPVSPGDLITAEFMNGLIKLVNKISDLESRVVKLESAPPSKKPGRGPVTITGIKPAKETYTLGETITVEGGDFGYSVGGHRVKLNKTPVLSFGEGSNDTALIFKMVTIDGLPESGPGDVLLSVGNIDDTASQIIKVQASAQPVVGYMFLEATTIEPDPIDPGSAVTFGYELRSDTIEKRCTIKPQVLVNGDKVRPSILDDRWRELADGQIDMPAHGTRTFYISIASAPDEGKKITLNLDVEAENTRCLPDVQEYTSGSSGTVDKTIDMSQAIGVIPSNADIGYAIQVAPTLNANDTPTRIAIIPGITRAGVYNLSLAFEPSGGPWSAKFASSRKSTFTQEVTEENIPRDGSFPLNAEFGIFLTNANASPTTVIFTIARTGELKKRVKRFKLLARN